MQTQIEGTEATIYERGNGFPDVGDYVPGDDGELYRIVSMDTNIRTGAPGVGNHLDVRVVRVDWDAIPEGDEFLAQAIVASCG